MAEQKQRLTFISYSRADSEFALELAKELRSSGFYIWLDQLDIPTGVRWDDEVERALLECDIFMVILTPDSIASNNVKDEIGYAIDSNKRILPVLLENAVLPFRLRRFQYVDFTKKSYDDGIKAAKELLRKLLSEPTSPVSLSAEDASKQEAASPTGKTESKSPSTASVEQQRAIAIQQARERERIERQDQVAHSARRKTSAARGQPLTKNVPLLAGAGLFSIVCLVAGWMIARSLILPPPTPATEVPVSTEATISVTLPSPISTFTPTATIEASFTPSATSTPTLTPFAPEEPERFIIFYFDTIIKNDSFDLAWNEMLTDDFKNENNPGPNGKQDWETLWKKYDNWKGYNFTVTTRISTKGEKQAIVTGVYEFGTSKKTSTLTYCLVRDESRNTWMIDHKPNCSE